jgi:hypothetical protein
MAFYILSALLGWFGGNYIYSLLPSAFRQNHPLWSAGVVGGIVGLAIPTLFNAVQGVLSK